MITNKEKILFLISFIWWIALMFFHIPEEVFYTGIIAFTLGACVMAWDNQREPKS